MLQLQVKGGGFDCFLFLRSQLREAVGEGVGDAKFHCYKVLQEWPEMLYLM